MATLFDLAQAYLNRALPETFKYDRTPPIGTNPPGLFPQPPVKPVEKILPVQGGNEEGFSVYNPDPNRTRNESNYNPRTYNKVMRDTDKFGETVMPNPDLYYQRPLEGIPGMVQGYMKNSIPGQLIGKAVSGIESLLPVNRRAIYENELLGQGIKLDDIGRIVSDGGNINTAENIMAGYNANKVTAETFQKRRDMINAKMSDKVNPKTGKTFKQEKLDALDAAEAKMLGTANTRADMVFEDKMTTKDPSLKGPGYLDSSFPGIGGITDIKGPPSIISRPKPPTGINRPGTPSKPKGPPTGIKGPPSIISRPKTKPKPSRPGPKTPISDRGRGESNVSPKSKGPVSTKGQAGPPSQRGGGGGGGGGGCFLKGTLITMFDGTKKPVEQVDLGNEVAIGGKVFATGKFLVKNLHDYKGIKVSGSHMVSENNKWVRVEDSEHGKLLGNEEHTVYVFGSEDRRILINDILFTDYFEVNEQDKLMNNEEDFFDNWKLYAKQDSGNNVDIINAS